MASSSMKASFLGKRKPEDDLETKPFLRKHKQQETRKEFDDNLELELSVTKSDEANLISVKDTVEGLDFVEFQDAAARKKTLFAGIFNGLSKISDIIDFFKDVGQVAGVGFVGAGYGFVEFASAYEAKKALEKKNGEYLHKRKILLMKVHDETPDFVEKAAVPIKTLFVGHFSPHTEIPDIINFFKDVGQVVHVRLIVDNKLNHVGYGFVEFASADQAKKARLAFVVMMKHAFEKKNGEYLQDFKIFLDVVNKGATYLPPKYCIDHVVWCDDNLPRESLAVDAIPPKFVEGVVLVANLSPQTTKIQQLIDFFSDAGKVVGVRLIVNREGKHVGYGFVEFATAYGANEALETKNGEYLHDHRILVMKGLDKTRDSVEVVSVRTKTLFAASLAPRTRISDIMDFFKDVGQVVHVRLFVDHKGKHLGYGFVEFASANEATKALEKKNGEYLHGHEIYLDIYTTAPETQLSKYCIDHKVWHEDYLQGESLLIEEDAAAVEGLDETLDFAEEIAVRKKTVFVDKISDNMRMKNIIEFFAPVGEVVRVRLFVDHRGERLGCGFVEFASANEAKKAVEEKNGRSIFVNMAERARYHFRPKYKLAEKLWSEDNLRRESLDLETKKILNNQSRKITFSDVD